MLEQIVKTVKLMGNAFEFTAIHEDILNCREAIQAAINEVQRIEAFLSTYIETSEVSLINRNAGKEAVIVSKELIELIKRAIKISELTQGAFDISYGGVDDKLWKFDSSMKKLPADEDLKKTVQLVNYRNVIIDEKLCTVYLKNKGMKLGFGAIGKGYAAMKAKEIMLGYGIQNGVVNAAGDLTVWGTRLNGNPWNIGIALPEIKYNYFSTLTLNEGSIATSGDYEKYVIIDGKRYSHTIDPRTGKPVQGIKSVSIICPNAEMADALTTPVMVMGIDVGLNLINQLHSVACIIVDDKGKMHISKNLRRPT